MGTMKPYQILVFLLLCIISLSLITIVFPKNGIFLYTQEIKKDSVTTIDSVKLRFPNFASFFEIDTTKKVDLDDILNHKLDSNLLKELNSVEDSLKAFRQISMTNPSRIHYPNDNKEVLHSLFEALENAEENHGNFRILHYGDSQIEVDRITSYIREQLQQKFGGLGPGLQPAIQIIPNSSVSQIPSGNFFRYVSWGFADSTRAKHNRYGIMLNYCSLDNAGGSITFSPYGDAYPKSESYTSIKVLIGNTESEMTISLNSGGNKQTKTLKASDGVQLVDFKLNSPSKRVTVNFSGGGSPEIYGIALDGKEGVSVDNLPMRGCSGTIFKRTSAELLKKSYELMNVKCLFLQFGGNMMGSISSKKGAEDYGKEFYDQIMYLKNQKPDMDIIVIGPADMSKKIDGNLQTVKFLTDVRDALKKAAFDAGGAYWDVYEVMGGRNSMIEWKKEGLAGSDYIHFTPKGAKKIAELFYEALLNDYNEYRLEKRIKQINASAN